MTQYMLQLSLAIIPAFTISYIIHKISMPWETKKRDGERAEILSMLAKDVKRTKKILAKNLSYANSGKNQIAYPLSLNNWNSLKNDYRLKKYSNEPIFKEMIKQFKQLERLQTI